jgi:hypothetical protein
MEVAPFVGVWIETGRSKRNMTAIALPPFVGSKNYLRGKCGLPPMYFDLHRR